MNRDETRALLFLAAAMESRGWAPTHIDVDAWTLVLADLRHFDDARDAIVQHYRQSPHRVTPAEVLAGVKRIRTDRLARTPDAVPDADPDQPAAYVQALRDGRVRIASGLNPRNVPALVAGTFPTPPPTDWRPQLPARQTSPVQVLPPVDDPERMAAARAELAAMTPIPVPGDGIDTAGQP